MISCNDLRKTEILKKYFQNDGSQLTMPDNYWFKQASENFKTQFTGIHPDLVILWLKHKGEVC